MSDPIIAAGIGFRDGATLASVQDALARAGAAGVRRLALPARKATAPVIEALEAAGYDLTWIPADMLSAQETPTESPIARRSYQTGSVPEAAALALVQILARTLAAPTPGFKARIIVPRVISGDRMATAALAAWKETE